MSDPVERSSWINFLLIMSNISGRPPKSILKNTLDRKMYRSNSGEIVRIPGILKIKKIVNQKKDEVQKSSNSLAPKRAHQFIFSYLVLFTPIFCLISLPSDGLGPVRCAKRQWLYVLGIVLSSSFSSSSVGLSLLHILERDNLLLRHGYCYSASECSLLADRSSVVAYTCMSVVGAILFCASSSSPMQTRFFARIIMNGQNSPLLLQWTISIIFNDQILVSRKAHQPM